MFINGSEDLAGNGFFFLFFKRMPVINMDDLTDKDKALMEVNQLKTEIKLERWLVSVSPLMLCHCLHVFLKSSVKTFSCQTLILDKQKRIIVNLFKCNYTNCNSRICYMSR